MAKIVFGFGTSHSPLLSTSPDKWHLRVEADKKNPSLEYKGSSYNFDQLCALRKKENLDHQSSLAVRSERHAASQKSIKVLSEKLEHVGPDVLIIIGNDQKEVFDENNTPSISMLYGDSVEHMAIPKERLEKMPPGIAIAAEAVSAITDTSYPIDAEFSAHIIRSLTENNFDIAAMKSLPTSPSGRRGMSHAYGFIYRKIMTKPIPAIHVCLNTFYPPNQPTAARCVALGQAIGKAVTTYDNELRVAVCGSGGLSHFVIDEDFDQTVIDGLKNLDMELLSSLPEELLCSGTSEIKNWITTAAILKESNLEVKVIDYIPCYRSEAGTGNAMGFMTWE